MGKRLFRYPVSDICMVISVMICFASMFLVLTQINEIDMLEREKNLYANTYEYKLSVNGELNRDIIEQCREMDCNVVLNSYLMYVDDLDVTYIIEIVLNAPETLNYILESGEYSQEGVYIGRNVKNKLRENDKITINGSEYKVSGVFGGKSDILDNKIVIYFNALKKTEVINIMNLNYYDLTLYSNTGRMDQVISTLKEKIPALM